MDSTYSSSKAGLTNLKALIEAATSIERKFTNHPKHIKWFRVMLEEAYALGVMDGDVSPERKEEYTEFLRTGPAKPPSDIDPVIKRCVYGHGSFMDCVDRGEIDIGRVYSVIAEWTDYPKKPLREVLGISLEDLIAWDGGSDEVLKMIAERKAY